MHPLEREQIRFAPPWRSLGRGEGGSANSIFMGAGILYIQIRREESLARS